MQRLLSNKFLLIGMVAASILIPLEMIDGLVSERQNFHRQAIREMSAASTGAQRLAGPVLLLPCEETYPALIREAHTGSDRLKTATRDCTTYALPERLTIEGSMASDIRSRGIHDALFYGAEIQVHAHFRLPARFGSGAPDTHVKLGEASLNIGVADTRGVMNVPELVVNDRSIAFAPGNKLPVLGNGIHAMIGETTAGRIIDVSFPVRLRGLERFDIVPLGQETTVAIRSSWRHPSFVGRYLPTTRRISDSGFEARWSTSHFSTGLEQVLAAHFKDADPSATIAQTSFGVTLMDPVDLYTQADRAVKYGFLFVLLTFIALLGTEMTRRLRLHPLQYTMVGVALATFFLLLLSLAEHIGFKSAYLAAAGACVSLLGYYLRHVVGSRGAGLAFAATLTTLYGVLYCLLASEDYALLSGALFVFAVLAAVMILTRNVDWYALGNLGVTPGPTADIPAPRA